jgi:uncharacterized protein (TIGR02246 family)
MNMIQLGLLLTLFGTQSNDQVTTGRALEQIEQQLATTWKNGDCAAWAAFLAPEWSVIHITGNVIPKSTAVEMCRAPEVRLAQMTIDQLSVRSFDDAAVVTGRTTATTTGPKPETITVRFTDVFIRRDGRWQVVASHATQLIP